jgi:hypothetical protein
MCGQPTRCPLPPSNRCTCAGCQAGVAKGQDFRPQPVDDLHAGVTGIPRVKLVRSASLYLGGLWVAWGMTAFVPCFSLLRLPKIAGG